MLNLDYILAVVCVLICSLPFLHSAFEWSVIVAFPDHTHFFKPPVIVDTVRSKTMVQLLLVYCWLLSPLCACVRARLCDLITLEIMLLTSLSLSLYFGLMMALNVLSF